MRQSARRRPLMAEINVVPYIDVMLVLLVIFMVTVPLIQQGVEVKLPPAEAKVIANQDAPDPLIVTVNKDGNISLNQGPAANRSLSPSFLARELRPLLSAAASQVYVRGDRDAQYGQVVAVMVILQQEGVTDIGLMTEPPNPTPANPTPQ